jgi:hypothetical protein
MDYQRERSNPRRGLRMNERTLERLREFQRVYQDGQVNQLANSEEGFRFLLLRSLARKEYLEKIASEIGVAPQTSIKKYLDGIYLSDISRFDLERIIRDLDAFERSGRRRDEENILAELFKLRAFDWGGIHENDINKYLVDNYVKKITSYDDLVDKIENEILESLKGFVLCSWYNNWTSIIIEDIFKTHPRVLPTVGKIKQVDFFIDSIPFDLKMTYFPVGFMEEQRQRHGVVKSEVSELKRVCKKFNLPIDFERSSIDVLLDMIAALSESSNPLIKEIYGDFVERRRIIINETMENPKPLLKWLYERQGIQRFDTSNRLFLISIDQSSMENSWKLKRDHSLLQSKINDYLASPPKQKQDLLLDWGVGGRTYQSLADVIFVVK